MRSPSPVLGAAVPLTWSDILLRTLYYLGVLAGGGVAVFALLDAAHRSAPALQRPLAHLLFFSLLLAFLGGSGILHAAPPGTRFALVMKVALTVSLAGGAAAALAPTIPRLLPVAYAAALALLAAPTLSGHALDRDQPRVLAVIVDLAHTDVGRRLVRRPDRDRLRGAARDRRRCDATRRRRAVLDGRARLGDRARRERPRARVTELSSVSQLWSTSYGRALLVKTAIFVPLLGVGWLNRARADARLRAPAPLGPRRGGRDRRDRRRGRDPDRARPGRKASRSLAAAPLGRRAPADAAAARRGRRRTASSARSQSRSRASRGARP